jgi:hypothetical protein
MIRRLSRHPVRLDRALVPFAATADKSAAKRMGVSLGFIVFEASKSTASKVQRCWPALLSHPL